MPVVGSGARKCVALLYVLVCRWLVVSALCVFTCTGITYSVPLLVDLGSGPTAAWQLHTQPCSNPNSTQKPGPGLDLILVIKFSLWNISNNNKLPVHWQVPRALCFCKGVNIKSDLSKNQWSFSIDCNGMLNCYAIPSSRAKLDRW